MPGEIASLAYLAHTVVPYSILENRLTPVNLWVPPLGDDFLENLWVENLGQILSDKSQRLGPVDSGHYAL